MNKVLGYIWASPVTVVGLLYVLAFQLVGWYSKHGRDGDAIVWIVNDTAPTWLLNLWKGWSGQTLGNVVVLRQPVALLPIILVHEKKHVDQCMRLGVFWPFAYFMTYFAVKFGCPGSDPYYSNSLEIDARRAAGQVIDIEGVSKKLIKLQAARKKT